ncbi:MAG: nuclear transport factor 2 family protein [Dokdonella sp.]
MQIIRSMALALVLLLIPMVSVANPDADPNEVWQLEQKYWQYAKDNDVLKYLDLWDSRFVGWPGGNESPTGKDQIANWIAPLHSNPDEQFDYELSQKALRSFGDVVVVHYLARYFYRNPENLEIVRELGVSRITHTWQRRDGKWQIITGMSAEHSEN